MKTRHNKSRLLRALQLSMQRRLYELLWNAAAGLYSYQLMMARIIKTYIPPEQTLDILYLNSGVGEFEEMITGEYGFACITSLNKNPIGNRIAYRRNGGVRSRHTFMCQDFRTRLKTDNHSIDVIICMEKPTPFMLQEFDRVLRPRSIPPIIVAPKVGSSLWPKLKVQYQILRNANSAWMLRKEWLNLGFLYCLYLAERSLRFSKFLNPLYLDEEQISVQERHSMLRLNSGQAISYAADLVNAA